VKLNVFPPRFTPGGSSRWPRPVCPHELLDALRAGSDLDIIRKGLAVVLQALIDAEATQHCGARPYERTEQRTAHRNGTRSRLLSTKAGDVELWIPKLREGAFFPSLLEPNA
jgi:putative transposase